MNMGEAVGKIRSILLHVL